MSTLKYSVGIPAYRSQGSERVTWCYDNVGIFGTKWYFTLGDYIDPDRAFNTYFFADESDAIMFKLIFG